jgi:hypothetical protein
LGDPAAGIMEPAHVIAQMLDELRAINGRCIDEIAPT